MSRPFSREAMTAAMREIAAVLSTPAEDARLMQMTNNAVFALPEAGLVIRIARTRRLRNRVSKVVQLAQWFAEIDAPTIRLAPDVVQPVQVGPLLASVWQYVPPTPPPPTAEDLGSVLREFHRLGPVPIALPQWDPVGDARSRIADADGLSEDDRRYLLDWCDRLDAPVAALALRAGSRLIHGDAHAANLLRDHSGQVVFCDFDATTFGPWQVDLVAVAVGEERFGRSGAHAALAAAYGYDVTTDPSWPLLREARELKMIAAAVPLLLGSAGVRAEFTARLQSVRASDHEARWVPFAQIGHRQVM